MLTQDKSFMLSHNMYQYLCCKIVGPAQLLLSVDLQQIQTLFITLSVLCLRTYDVILTCSIRLKIRIVTATMVMIIMFGLAIAFTRIDTDNCK